MGSKKDSTKMRRRDFLGAAGVVAAGAFVPSFNIARARLNFKFANSTD